MKFYMKPYKELSLDDLYAITCVRMQTFIVEQALNYVELDQKDKEGIHVWIADQEGIQAYLRIFDNGDGTAGLGRVLTRKRGVGLGRAIVKAGIEAIKTHYPVKKIVIHAQSYVQSLYAKEGFVPSSEEFLEEGIKHVEMTLDL